MANRLHESPTHFDATIPSLPVFAPVSRGVTVPAPTTVDFDALSEVVLLQRPEPSKHGPNVLIQCSQDTADATVQQVLAWSGGRVTLCVLPGALSFPEPGGVLVLNDAGALTMRQQVQLYDHLSGSVGGTQVISVTTASLPSLVADGAFLEALYYRLNMIRLDAAL